MNFSLTPAATELKPMVVTGYGKQDRRIVTGAFSTVSAAQLQDIPTSDPMKALQGRVAGVDIVASSNEPGAAMSVRIRGVRSLTASNDPLYVVDGVPLAGGIQDFNPAMIESIDILKDAAATAIYGSRGANGVILVTTKKGGLDGIHTQFTADMYYGNQAPLRLIPMMNLQQYVQYMKDGAAQNGQDTSIAKIFTAKQQLAIKNNISTDWQNAVLRTGLQRSLQGGANGGSGDTRYALNGNYFGQQGLIPGQGYTRGSAFATLDHTSDRLRVGLTANTSRIITDQGEGGGAYGYALAMTPLGKPTNFTNPDSAGLLDPRPDDDLAEHQPGARVAVGHAAADREPRLRLRVRGAQHRERTHLPHELRSRLHGAQRRLLQRTVDPRHLREPRRQQQQPGAAAAGRRFQPGRLHLHARQHPSAEQDARRDPSVRHHGPVQLPARPLHERLTVRVEPSVPDAALVRPRVGHGRQRSEPDLGVGAPVVHGSRELHVVRPLLALGNRSHRRFEPSGAGA